MPAAPLPAASDSRQHPVRARSSARRWLARLMLLSITLVVLAAVLEAGTRLFTDTVPPLTNRHPLYGQTYMPCFEGDVYSFEAGRKVALRFNHDGFRGPARSKEKPPGTRRVAILGDSMIAGIEVDEADTLAHRLEALLNSSHPSARWEVQNFGVAGASTGQELALYRNLVREYQPDFVVCAFFIGNDLADNCSRLSMNPRIYFDFDAAGQVVQQPFSARRAAATWFLNRYSRFYVWQKAALASLREQARDATGTISPGRWIFSTQESDDVVYAWRLTGALFERFHTEVTADGARPLLVVLPSAMQVYDDYFHKELAGEDATRFHRAHPNGRLAALAAAADLPLLDLTPDFRAAAPQASTEHVDEWLFQRGVGHFNERGHELAADVIHRHLGAMITSGQVADDRRTADTADKPRQR